MDGALVFCMGDATKTRPEDDRPEGGCLYDGEKTVVHRDAPEVRSVYNSDVFSFQDKAITHNN